MKKQIRAAIFVMLFSLLVWTNTTVSAQTEAETNSASACTPVDIVFLVDQSSSMSGANGGIPTDPLEQRQFAIQAVIDQLADNALDLCPDTTHRIAIISYGSEAEIDLPLSTVNPDNAEEAQQIRIALKQSIDARNMGQTNPQAAFELATQVLDNAASIGNEIRKRAIVFITDGQPCVGERCLDTTFPYVPYAQEMQRLINEDLPFDPTLLQQERCLQALRQELEPGEELPPEARTLCLDQYQVGPEAYENSTYIWTVLLRNNQAYDDNLREIFVEISEDHAGQVIDLSNNRQEVPSTFRDILEQLTGVRAARLTCGNFAVNPYLEKATLTFYKFDESLQVSLAYTDADGNRHELSNGSGDGFGVAEYRQEGPNERYVLDRPYPGIWQLQSENCDGLDAIYDPIKFDLADFQRNIPGRIPQRDRPPYYDADEVGRHYLEYQMRAGGQVVSQADTDIFAIDLKMVIVQPDGKEVAYEMEWVETDKLFRALEPLQVPVVGTYIIQATGTTLVNEGEPAPVDNAPSQVFDTEQILFDQQAEFEVFPVTPFQIRLLAPAAGEVLRPIHGRAMAESSPPILPITVRAEIVDRENNPSLNLDEVLEDANTPLTAIVRAGNREETIELARDVANPGVYSGLIQAFDAEGEHQLTVELNSRFEESYYPDNRSDSITFRREDMVWQFEIMTPASGAQLQPVHGTIRDGWPLPIQPLPVSVQLVDESGEPLSPDDPLLQYSPEIVHATLTAGAVRAENVLRLDSETPGQYTGIFEDFDGAGEHQLVVDLDLTYPEFTPESRSATQRFSRTDGIWNLALTYYLIALAILLYILFRIYRFFAIRSNPIMGVLEFSDSTTVVFDPNLYSGKNWKVFKPRDFRPYPQLELKRVRAENRAKKKRRKVTNDMEPDFSLDASGMEQTIRVQYVLESGTKQVVDLPPDTPTSYGSGVYQMTYKPVHEN